MKAIHSPARALLCVLLALAAVARAEDPKPEAVKPPAPNTAPAPAGPDWMQIFRDLQSPDNIVKEAAVQALTKLLDAPAKESKKPYFAKFKLDLASNDIPTRDAALLAAANVGQLFQNNRRHFPEVLKDLMGADEKLRAVRLDAIFKTLEATLLSNHAVALIEKLGSEDAKVQADAEAGLREMKGDAADDLANALDEDKPTVKRKCAELLRNLGPDAKEGLDTLVFKLRDEDDKLGRKLAAQTLEALGVNAAGAADGLKDNLDDDDKILRKLSFNILKKMAPAYKEVTADLVGMYLQHAEPAVRNAAAELLILLGPDAKDGVSDLVEIIDDTPPATPAATPPAVPPATPPAPATPPQPADANSKLLAVKVLASIGPAAKEALPSLKKLEAAAEAELKEAVKDAIEKISAEKK